MVDALIRCKGTKIFGDMQEKMKKNTENRRKRAKKEKERKGREGNETGNKKIPHSGEGEGERELRINAQCIDAIILLLRSRRPQR